MLKFDEIVIEYTYGTIAEAKNSKRQILIHDEYSSDSGVSLTLEKAKWVRDNIDYIIKRFE